MGYNSPSYTSLSENTEVLLKIFNNLSNRYISASYEKIRMKVDGLEKKYNEKAASKSYGTSNKPLRQNQIGCINQLLNKLPLPNEKDKKIEEKDKKIEAQAHNILLGAIFYRFRQLEASYKPLKKPKPKPFWHYTNYTGLVNKLWTDERSALCNLLDEEFHLRKDLDHETIVTCCEAYLSFLKQPDNNFNGKQLIADQFPYIKDSKEEFFKKLENVISVSKKFARSAHRQLQFIGYVQSVAKALKENDIKVAEVLKALTNEVEKQLQKVESLSYLDLIKLLPNLKMEPVYKEQLAKALPERVTKDGVLYNDQYYSFLYYTSEILAIKSRNVLLGAYGIALAHCTNEEYNNLRDTLNRGINAVVNNQLDDNARKKGLDALTDYMSMKIPELSLIDYSAWGEDSGDEEMRKALDIILNQVNESLGLKVVNQSLDKETKSEKTLAPY